MKLLVVIVVVVCFLLLRHVCVVTCKYVLESYDDFILPQKHLHEKHATHVCVGGSAHALAAVRGPNHVRDGSIRLRSARVDKQQQATCWRAQVVGEIHTPDDVTGDGCTAVWVTVTVLLVCP